MKQFNIFAWALFLMLMGTVALQPNVAHAQTTPAAAAGAAAGAGAAAATDDTCTTFAIRAATATNADGTVITGGMLSEIYNFIKQTIGSATQQLFTAFTDSPEYQAAVTAAVTLMVIFYAVGFVIGIVQPSFQQVLIRVMKLAVVFAIISPAGWTFFSANVVTFFQDGSDQLIKGVQAIGFGMEAPDGATPFYALDQIANFLIQPDTIIAILGAVGAGGPFGLTMGALLALALWGFMKLVLKALEIYATTFVARALVLGVAPIFFVFLLFDRTKNMFIAWVNALINLSLQPILMFTFLSFFLVMIQSAAQNMLGTELCWHEYKNVESGVNKQSFWRFKEKTSADPTGTTTVNTGDATWNGSLECLIGPLGKVNKCPAFPLNILDILSFLILVFIASKFAEVTNRIAGELSNAVVNLDNQGKLEQIMQEANNKGGNVVSNVNKQAGGAAKSVPRTPTGKH